MIKFFLLVVVFLAGCTAEQASPDFLEQQRGVANDNGKFNAQRWRAENGYENYGILSRGDSTQQANCSQGDGWATIDLVDAQTKKPVVSLKCSTYSANVGCYTSSDFKARSQLSTQENNCNGAIPKTLKKIEQ